MREREFGMGEVVKPREVRESKLWGEGMTGWWLWGSGEKNASKITSK